LAFPGEYLLILFSSLPARWNNKSIIVLDNVVIEPPYGVEDCKAPPKHVKQLERVKELVKNELERVQKDNTLGRRGG
jgi:protein LSM12